MRHPLWILNSSLLIIFIIVLFFILFSREDLPVWQDIEPSGPVKAIQTKAAEINIKKIYENDLFGTYHKPAFEAEKTGELLPLPQAPTPRAIQIPQQPIPKFLDPLKITLKGIIAVSYDDSKNRAIVADLRTKKETVYKVGDFVEDAQLIKIFNSKVIFLRANGQQEVLYLREKDAEFDPAYAVIDDWKGTTQQITQNAYLINPSEITKRIVSLAQFIDLLDLTTVYKQGASIGCRIGKMDANSLGSQLGLQNGDIVVSVNSIPATNTPNRLKIYQNIVTLKPNDLISVELLRNNRPLTLKYTIGPWERGAGKKSTESLDLSTKQKIEREKEDILKKKHTFAPTLSDIRAKERENMLHKGKLPNNKQSPNKIK